MHASMRHARGCGAACQAPFLPYQCTHTDTHTASVVTALILLSTEPKIDMDYFTVQCTGQYKDRYACGCNAPRTKPWTIQSI